MVQDTIRKRAATSAAARLEPLRERLRRARVLRETWEAIAERRNSRGQSRVKHFQARSATDANKSDCKQSRRSMYTRVLFVTGR